MPEKGIPSLKMAFQMPTKCQHAGIIRHLTNRTIARNNGTQKNTASNYKCQTGLNAAIAETFNKHYHTVTDRLDVPRWNSVNGEISDNINSAIYKFSEHPSILKIS